ncbi:unnamed protein product [Thelazia callipaeda]|uniref:Tyrosine-protein kinase n=1 Tax=Thelazia callipaeda TaxID=103827 RepID=A0A0N5D3I8_THECL|nr:unnamed protein product [Thelazia callipaeda]
MSNETELESALWYHGLLPREDIESLLVKDGNFLVRETKIEKGKHVRLVLSVRCDGKILHFIINEKAGKVYITNRHFCSVEELIRYYSTSGNPITQQSGAVLLYAVPRQHWEFQHEQIKLYDLIGEGAISAVYKGVLADNNKLKQVAVKVCKASKSNREVIKEICREARVLRKLCHPNIVRLYGIAISKEPIMLLLELLEDGSLDMLLLTKGMTLSIRRKLYFCLDIASGLEFLHENNFIHRDISARNCLVENMCVKITDFNFSRMLEDQKGIYCLKQLNQKLPVRWSAPETLKLAIYTKKSDVFSYGIILWEIFTNGMQPYCGMTIAEVKNGYRIPSPESMPKRLQAIQQNCLITNASERWSMAEIRREVEMICLNFQN